MKRNSKKKLSAVFLAFLLMLAMAACGGQPSDDGSDVNTINVTMNILYPESAQKENVENYGMQIQEDATVLQILESYTDQAGIKSELDTSGTPYITSIDGVKAEGSSGWVYEVNDESITKGASEYEVKDGDKITWKYVTF